MWWKPTTRNDDRLSSAVSRIAGLMREGASALPWLPRASLHGVGTILLAPEFRVLLLAVDAPLIMDCLPWRYRHYERPGRWLGRHAQGRIRGRGFALVSLMDLAIPFGALLDQGPRHLGVADFGRDTMVLVTEPPTPMLFREGAIRSGSSRGSIGLSVELQIAGSSPTRGYTTAGHVIGDAFVRRTPKMISWQGREHHPDMVVVAANSASDPKAEGYDIAVVESRASLSRSASLANHGVSQPSDCDASVFPRCTMLGGASGSRYGFVYGAMTLQQGRHGEVWENCWTVCGDPRWLARQGDSGAAVTLHGSGKVLGHLVAGVGSGYGGRFQLGWVQDIGSQLAFLHRRFSMSLS